MEYILSLEYIQVQIQVHAAANKNSQFCVNLEGHLFCRGHCTLQFDVHGCPIALQRQHRSFLGGQKERCRVKHLSEGGMTQSAVHPSGRP
jgi:hypothetical protein